MIRPMTTSEIRKALRRAAQVCIEKERICWDALDVCVADGAARAANGFADDSDDADTPVHAATFLLFCAEAI